MKYLGLSLDQAKKFKNQEKDNARLRKLSAEAEFNNAIPTSDAVPYSAPSHSGVENSSRVVILCFGDACVTLDSETLFH